MKKLSAIFFVSFAVVSHARSSDEAALRRVADHVIVETTRRLVDDATGRIFPDTDGLDPAPQIRIESKFNAWFYQTWLLADGMRRTASVLKEPAYQDYGLKNLEFIYQNMGFFAKQDAAGMRMAPVGDGKLSPIGFHFKLDALWHTGLAPLVMERHAETHDATI